MPATFYTDPKTGLRKIQIQGFEGGGFEEQQAQEKPTVQTPVQQALGQTIEGVTPPSAGAPEQRYVATPGGVQKGYLPGALPSQPQQQEFFQQAPAVKRTEKEEQTMLALRGIASGSMAEQRAAAAFKPGYSYGPKEYAESAYTYETPTWEGRPSFQTYDKTAAESKLGVTTTPEGKVSYQGKEYSPDEFYKSLPTLSSKELYGMQDQSAKGMLDWLSKDMRLRQQQGVSPESYISDAISRLQSEGKIKESTDLKNLLASQLGKAASETQQVRGNIYAQPDLTEEQKTYAYKTQQNILSGLNETRKTDIANMLTSMGIEPTAERINSIALTESQNIGDVGAIEDRAARQAAIQKLVPTFGREALTAEAQAPIAGAEETVAGMQTKLADYQQQLAALGNPTDLQRQVDTSTGARRQAALAKLTRARDTGIAAAYKDTEIRIKDLEDRINAAKQSGDLAAENYLKDMQNNVKQEASEVLDAHVQSLNQTATDLANELTAREGEYDAAAKSYTDAANTYQTLQEKLSNVNIPAEMRIRYEADLNTAANNLQAAEGALSNYDAMKDKFNRIEAATNALHQARDEQLGLATKWQNYVTGAIDALVERIPEVSRYGAWGKKQEGHRVMDRGQVERELKVSALAGFMPPPFNDIFKSQPDTVVSETTARQIIDDYARDWQHTNDIGTLLEHNLTPDQYLGGETELAGYAKQIAPSLQAISPDITEEQIRAAFANVAKPTDAYRWRW